ncbi:unnamed protein product, partial [Fusarium equiseti]
MEAAGLAIGVIGIAGLFNTCLDSLSRFQAYKSSTADYHVLDTRFRAAKARFEKWGPGVGISEGRLLSDHHSGLDNSNTSGVITDILNIIAKAICDDGNVLQNDQFAGLQSRRKRLKWALGGKEDRTEQVEIFEKLVQQLYNLVPVDDKSREHVRQYASEDWSDVKKILLNIEQGMKNEMRRDVYSWLGVSSSSDKYQDSLDERVENTCGWIFDRPEFKTWVSPEDPSSPNLLWINGPAGFGKTILCAHIAQHLSKVLTTPVAYFFFTSNQDTPYLALRSWIHQIADGREEAFDRDEPEIRDALDETTAGFTEYKIVPDDAAFAKRRLTVYEITEAALMTQFEELDPDDYPDEMDDDYIRTEIVGLCSPLLEVKDIVVYVPHFSVRQYLGQHLPLPSWLKENGYLQTSYEKLDHTVLAKACLLYLGFPQTWEDEFDYGNRYRTLRFYAAAQWVYHSKNSERDSPVWGLASDLLREDNPLWQPLSAYTAEAMARERGEDEEAHQPFHPLEYTLNFGWKDMANYLINDNNVNKVGSLGRTPLMQASEEEDMYETVERLLEAGAAVGAVGREKHTALHRAAKNGLEENIKILVKHGADLSAQGDEGWTPLHAAAANGSLKSCQVLIKGGSDLTVKDHRGMNPLHLVYHEVGRSELARMMLQHDSGSMVLEMCPVGAPVHFTSVTGDVEMARLLMEHGGAPALALLTESGVTALMMAALGGHVELVKLFLEHGADTTLSFAAKDIRSTVLHMLCVKEAREELFEAVLRPGVEESMLMLDELWRIPLHIACHNGMTRAVELILGYNGANVKAMLEATTEELWTPLWMAAWYGHLEIVKTLLDHGATDTIAAVDRSGKTVLWEASRFGYTEIVRVLLNRGAEETITTISMHGCTPLCIASYHGHADTVRVLLEHGAASTIALGDVDNITPLHAASGKGYLEIVKMLLSHGDGSALGMLDVHGMTPLYEAADRGHVEVVKELLAHGAGSTITTLTWFENTPLYAACTSGEVEIVEQFLDCGAASTVNLINKYGNTPLHAAIYQDNVEMVKLLLEHGAEKTITTLDSNGHSPLYMAATNANIEIVDLLLKHGAEASIATPGKDGSPLLYAAAEGGSWEIYQRLLTYPDVESTTMLLDVKNKSLLSAASAGGCVKIMKDLLNCEARKYAALPSKAGETPLLYAANCDYVDIVQLLISIPEYPINYATHYGVTPLFLASRFGNIETVKLLLSRDDIDIDCENWKALTPLYAAVANGHIGVAELLISKGSTLDAWPTVGQPLLWWAQRSGKPDMVELLEKHGMTMDTIGPYRHHRRVGPRDDAASVVFDGSSGYCD